MLRKIAVVAATCLALVACSQDEHIPQSAGEVVAIVTNELGFPEATALENTLEADEQGILNLKVQVQIGINRSDDNPLAAICTAIVFWHRNSPEDLLEVEGGYLMQDPTNDEVFNQLSQFEDCWQS